MIEFLTDPTAASILKGDADRGSMIKQGFKAKMQEFLPGREKPGREKK